MKWALVIAAVVVCVAAQDDPYASLLNNNGPATCPSGEKSTGVQCNPKKPWPTCAAGSYCYVTNSVDIGPYYCCQVWSTVGAIWRPTGPLEQGPAATNPPVPAPAPAPTAAPYRPPYQPYVAPPQPQQPRQNNQYVPNNQPQPYQYYVYNSGQQQVQPEPPVNNNHTPFQIPRNTHYLTSAVNAAAAIKATQASQGQYQPFQYEQVVAAANGYPSYTIRLPPRFQRNWAQQALDKLDAKRMDKTN